MPVLLRPAFFVLLALCLASLASPPPVHACSCVPPRIDRTVLPADGATDVPVDATLRVLLHGFPVAMRADLGGEYRLIDTAGRVVPLDVVVAGNRLDLRPRAPLGARATYTLEQVFAFGRDGARLTDTERFMAPAGSVRGAFFPVSRFTTRPSSAARALTVRTREAGLQFRQGGGDCGPGASLGVVPEPVAGALPTDLYELRIQGLGAVRSALTTESHIHVGDLLCDPDPITLPSGRSVSYQLAVIDASGREIGATGWETVTGGGRRRPGRTFPAGRASVGWSSTSLIATPALRTATGPRGCAHGLEETARLEVVPDGSPWAFGDRASSAVVGVDAWLAYPGQGSTGSPPVRLFSLPPPSGRAQSPWSATSHPSSIAGMPELLLSSSSALFVVARSYAPGGGGTATINALDASGGPGVAPRVQWSHPIESVVGRYRGAVGGGQLLIAYGRRAPDYSESLSFVFFDAATGAPSTTLDTAQGIDTNAEGAAVAYFGGRFVVAWPSGVGLSGRGPFRVASVDAAGLGTPADLAIDSYSPPDLVAADGVGGLATATRSGQVQLSILDPSGQISGGPFEVSRGVGGGDNRNPRVAWDGQRFAVLWETHPDTGANVTVIDATGHVAPPLRIDRAEINASGLAIVPTPRGFVASYTGGHGDHGMVVALGCRSQPPSGPPPSIGALTP
jgi:hypothetical protein